MYKKLRIAIAQAEAIPARPDLNEEKLVLWTKRAAAKGADIICFPELFYSAYDVNAEELKECAITCDDDFFKRIGKLAADEQISILISYPEKVEGQEKPHISYAFIGTEGKMLDNHRKSYLWDDESERVERGAPVYNVIDTPFGKIGTLICYEIEFPEPSRILTLNGAEIIIVPVAMNTIPNFHRYISATGIMNHVYAIGINGIRPNEEHKRGGGCVANQHGKLLTVMSEAKEELRIIDIDLNENNRRNKEPHMSDFSIETLNQLGSITEWK